MDSYHTAFASHPPINNKSCSSRDYGVTIEWIIRAPHSMSVRYTRGTRGAEVTRAGENSYNVAYWDSDMSDGRLVELFCTNREANNIVRRHLMTDEEYREFCTIYHARASRPGKTRV